MTYFLFLLKTYQNYAKKLRSHHFIFVSKLEITGCACAVTITVKT